MLDTSASVGGSLNYWSTVLDLLNNYGSKIHTYYFWNTKLEKVNKRIFKKAIKERKGWGGTSPQLVAKEVLS